MGLVQEFTDRIVVFCLLLNNNFLFDAVLMLYKQLVTVSDKENSHILEEGRLCCLKKY